MIKEVIKYANNWELYPSEVFNCLDRNTDKLTEPKYSPDENYYPFLCGDRSDRFYRVVNLRFVDACTTDASDDLTEYGFSLIREFGEYKFWVR